MANKQKKVSLSAIGETQSENALRLRLTIAINKRWMWTEGTTHIHSCSEAFHPCHGGYKPFSHGMSLHY